MLLLSLVYLPTLSCYSDISDTCFPTTFARSSLSSSTLFIVAYVYSPHLGIWGLSSTTDDHNHNRLLPCSSHCVPLRLPIHATLPLFVFVIGFVPSCAPSSIIRAITSTYAFLCIYIYIHINLAISLDCHQCKSL